MPDAMTTVDAYLQRVLAAALPLEPLELHLLDAVGCVLASDVVADVPVPGFASALVDGYAVRAADVAAAPITLHVVGDVTVGHEPSITVQEGLCARVFQGAAVPVGADTVVPAEWTDRGLAQVSVSRPVPAWSYVRRAGEDAAVGSVVVRRGELVTSMQLPALASLGRATVLAHPKPRVVVLSVGSELVEPGAPARMGKVPDATGTALLAAVREAGALPFRGGIVSEDARALVETLEDHLIQADLVVVAGGSHQTARDVLREVLARMGSVTFDVLAIDPGPVHGFGLVGDERTPLVVLPADAPGALVGFEVIVRPALRRMLGAEHLGRSQVRARLAAPVVSRQGIRQYLPVGLAYDPAAASWVATPRPGPLLAGLAAGSGLAVIAEDSPDLAAGDLVTTLVLERR